VGFGGSDSLRVDIASLRVDIASAADLPRRRGNRRFRAALVLLCHAGDTQEWRDECEGKDIFDGHDFSPAFTQKFYWQVTGLVALIFIKQRENASFLGCDKLSYLPHRREPRRHPKKTAFQNQPLS